jgi:hypothetical protein
VVGHEITGSSAMTEVLLRSVWRVDAPAPSDPADNATAAEHANMARTLRPFVPRSDSTPYDTTHLFSFSMHDPSRHEQPLVVPQLPQT